MPETAWWLCPVAARRCLGNWRWRLRLVGDVERLIRLISRADLFVWRSDGPDLREPGKGPRPVSTDRRINGSAWAQPTGSVSLPESHA